MRSLDPAQSGAANLLRARILVMLSSGSVAAALLSAGGCSGDVETKSSSAAGTGGSGSDTTGGTTGTGGGSSGGSSSGSSGRGGSATGGTGSTGGMGSTGGTGSTGGVSGQGGAGGVGGSAGSLGSSGSGGVANCSPPNLCLTCEELLQRFSYFLDGFSCGSSSQPVCPNLMGAGTMGCENVCTAPMVQGQLCCYGLSPAAPACGRPFTVGEEIRRAPIMSRADWKRAAVRDELSGLDPELERALAAEWEQDAVFEHASIASFARLTLELLALGAPAELVRESKRRRSTRSPTPSCVSPLPAATGDRRSGPVARRSTGRCPRPSFRTLAAETVREGCVGETLAALLAAEQLERPRRIPRCERRYPDRGGRGAPRRAFVENRALGDEDRRRTPCARRPRGGPSRAPFPRRGPTPIPPFESIGAAQ